MRVPTQRQAAQYHRRGLLQVFRGRAVISPGPIETPGLNELPGEGDSGRQRREGFSTSVTGVELFVDGGMAQA